MASNPFIEFRRQTIGFLFKDIDTFSQHEDKKAFLTNAWVMNEPTNRQLCIDLENALLVGVPDKFVLRCLYLGVNKIKRGIQFPSYLKKAKVEEDKYDWLKPVLATFYKIGSREMNFYWSQLRQNLNSEKYRLSMSTRLGLPNAMRKKLGLKPLTHDKKKN